MSQTKYWLMKSEPDVFGIDDLKNCTDGTEPWDGIRNYEARNFMRDQMSPGDKVLFYHSNFKPPHIAGIAEIVSDAYPDPTQFDPNSKYFDEKSTEDNPRWMLVDVKFVAKFDQPVSRDSLKDDELLSQMMIFKRNRLSITPVTKEEYEKVVALGGTTFE